jgi:hypothetical protein
MHGRFDGTEFSQNRCRKVPEIVVKIKKTACKPGSAGGNEKVLITAFKNAKSINFSCM